MDNRYTPTDASLAPALGTSDGASLVNKSRTRGAFPWLYILSRIVLFAVSVGFLWAMWGIRQNWEMFWYSDSGAMGILALTVLVHTLRLLGAILLVRRHSLAPVCLLLVLLIRIGHALYSGQKYGFDFEPQFIYGFAIDTVYLMIAMWMYKTKTSSAPPTVRAE